MIKPEHRNTLRDKKTGRFMSYPKSIVERLMVMENLYNIAQLRIQQQLIKDNEKGRKSKDIE